VTASVLFTAGRHLFGFYLVHAGTANSFGTAGSLAVLMMWPYFSAVVFLFGSEIAASIREAAQGPDETASQAPLSSAVRRR
jgi:membrane protein